MYKRMRVEDPDHPEDIEYVTTYYPPEMGPGPSRNVHLVNIDEDDVIWVDDENPSTSMAVDDSMGLDIDNTYEYLTGIFPNADPQYLRNTVESFMSASDVKNFVEDKLKTNDYPTRDQYSAKIRVTEELQRYTTNFNVEQFLTVFPDPFAHFENKARKCVFNVIHLEFLKREFRRLRCNTINRIYRASKFNMSIAAKELRLSNDFIKTCRYVREIPTENIPLLQEMAFVRHYEEIRKHVEAAKQKEQEEINALKAVGGLWTCECCYDEECLPSKCSTCGNAHVFCNSCILSGTDTKLADGEAHVPCFLDCGSEFSISTLQKVLPPTKFSILLKKRQAAEVLAAGLEGLVTCPFCDFASIPPEGEKVFKCLNPECMKESCILCKEPNHLPLKCGEVDIQNKARKYIEEKMTQALTRTCYKCKKVFFKETGCNKMTCTCGATMCYICNEPIKDYNHFSDGSRNSKKCPLYSDNNNLNLETVRRVEADARREILQEVPALRGTTMLFPDPTLQVPVRPRLGMDERQYKAETSNAVNIAVARVLNKGHFSLQEQKNENHE